MTIAELLSLFGLQSAGLRKGGRGAVQMASPRCGPGVATGGELYQLPFFDSRSLDRATRPRHSHGGSVGAPRSRNLADINWPAKPLGLPMAQPRRNATSPFRSMASALGRYAESGSRALPPQILCAGELIADLGWKRSLVQAPGFRG